MSRLSDHPTNPAEREEAVDISRLRRRRLQSVSVQETETFSCESTKDMRHISKRYNNVQHPVLWIVLIL
jgi:hypothetical protein